MVKIIKSSFVGWWSVELNINGETVEKTIFLTEESANRKVHLYNLRFGYKDDFGL